jgi:hypothetical protein
MIGFMAQIPTVEWVYKENISRAQSCQFNGDKMVDKAHTFERKFWFNTLVHRGISNVTPVSS